MRREEIHVKVLHLPASFGESIPICQAENHAATLTDGNLPYSASITVGEAGFDFNGKMMISYQMHLLSPKCKSDFSGLAKFYSTNESPNGDSEFLPNFHVVMTSMFKDENKYGGLDLALDVESKKPRYAAVYIKNYSDIDRGGCVDKSDAGYEFYSTKSKR